jgi:uncharacterized BrkB/YihY/UPF0761 family membrane protein
MTEKILTVLFSIFIIVLFGMNFNEKWSNRNYEKLKHKKYTWYWFKIFKVSETKENFIRFYRVLSLFVISIMTLTILIMLTRK